MLHKAIRHLHRGVVKAAFIKDAVDFVFTSIICG